MNVIFLSMQRCGVSWIGDTIKEVYKRLYNKELTINYENNRALISNKLVEGWHCIYDIDPKQLLKVGYKKIIIIKRDLDTMKEAHAKFHGYLEMFNNDLNLMKEKRPAFFKRIELQYNLLYNQELNDPRILIVSLEELNNYTHDTFNEIINFLNFKLNLIQKIKFFLRVIRNKIKPFVVPICPPNRNWNVYSALLPKGTELCNRLKYMKKIDLKIKEEKIKCQTC